MNVIVLTFIAVAASLIAWGVYGWPHAGYDASWALLWGRELADGQRPSLETAFAPTPHPLTNLVAFGLAPLGAHAATVLGALSLLSFGALVATVVALGRELFSVAVGIVAAVLVLTQPLLIAEAEQVVVDVPFLALVVGAACLIARGSRGWAPGVLLGVAGLLRPEAWLLLLAWGAWRGAGAPWTLALVAAPPLLWALADLLATGDPLHSLHGTRALAEELGRPRAAGTALSAVPIYLRQAAQPIGLWLGLVGAVLGLLWMPERSLFALTVGAVGVAAFLVLGLAGLPLLIRYLLLPSVVLALFAGVCVAGWTIPPPAGVGVFRAAGVVGAIALALSVPAAVRRVDDAVSSTAQRRVIQTDLTRIASSAPVRRAAAACGTVSVPDYRARPVVALAMDRRPSAVATATEPHGLAFVYATEAAARRFSIGLAVPRWGSSAGRLVAANGSWRVFASCGRG